MRTLSRLLVVAAATCLVALGLGALPAQAAVPKFSTVVPGGEHTCGITTTRSLYCWGSNGYGQLGSGSTSTSSPRKVGSLQWKVVAAGSNHSCGIASTGYLYCWGWNAYGQLGDGTTTQRTSPRKIGSLKWLTVSAGAYGTCAISTSKSLFCWGYNGSGQVGDGSTASRSAPRKVGSYTWSKVSQGGSSTCGITTSGSLFCWGFNGAGALGDGGTTNRSTPGKITTAATSWKSVGVGELFACGLGSNGVAWCWGNNTYNQIGDGTTTNRLSPVCVDAPLCDPGGAGTTRYSDITVGAYSSCARGARIKCWGYNATGAVGDGTTTNRSTPVAVSPRSDWTSVRSSGSSFTTCGVRSPGVGFCWGRGGSGQIGDAMSTDQLRPSLVG